MYEKILVPLDGSELAEVALPHAEELGWRISSEVTLLQVSETGESQRFHEHEVYLQREADLVKRNIVHHLGKDQEENIRVKSVVMEGYPAEEIVDYAEKSDIDMIIMATHGRTGVRRWALGSVADKVVRAASQPVVLIRTGGIHHGMTGMREKDMLNTILVPLDGSKESETILPYIEDLARRVEAEVILLQVVEMAHHVYAARGTVAPLPYDRNEMEALKEHAMEYLEGVSAPLRARGVIIRDREICGESRHRRQGSHQGCRRTPCRPGGTDDAQADGRREGSLLERCRHGPALGQCSHHVGEGTMAR